jgi:membrane-associated phospholipid phosphatase
MKKEARADPADFPYHSSFVILPSSLKNRLAYGLSVLLHPLLVPTYLLLLLCYGLPASLGLPPGTVLPLILPLQAWLLTFVLPGLLIWLLARRGFISSVDLPDRRQRTVPLLIAAACFAAATVLLTQVPQAGPLLSRLFGAITLSVLLTILITLSWKISAHGVGMGGAIGLIIWLLLAHRLPPAPGSQLLALMLLAAATVAWARLQLRAHTPAQVAAGLVLGTVVAVVVGLA